jgi:DNA-directed RNA polymerase subunit RPC12/RpoP
MNNIHQTPIDITKLVNISCENCNHPYFKMVFEFKRLSKIYSNDGNEKYFSSPVYICEKCNTPISVQLT